MATAKEVIKIALCNNGVKATTPGNVKFNTEYYGGKVSGKQFAWCAVFVWYCFRKSGAAKLFFNGKKTAYVPAVETYVKKKKKKTIINKTEGRLGDVVLFDFSGRGSSGHIGFILKKNGDGSYTTIEGNTSLNSSGSQANGQAVAIKRRTLGQIRMIYRPDYDKERVEKKPCYADGKSYYLFSARSVRTRPAITAGLIATFPVGEKVVCRDIKAIGKNVWIKTDQGWMAAYYNGKVHIG